MSEIKLVRARRVKALDGHRLEIVFDDDTMGVIDLGDFVKLGPATEPLRDPAFFAQVFIEMGVPTWPNGCDIDAIVIRALMASQGALKPVTEAA